MTISVTGVVVGGTVERDTLAASNSHYRFCPTSVGMCPIDGTDFAFSNEGAVLARVAVPEPGTAALVSVGLVSLAILRRAPRPS